MSTKFRSRQGLIVIPMEIFGPSGSTILRVALDTGARIRCPVVQALMAYWGWTF